MNLAGSQSEIEIVNDPYKAIEGCNAIYTDVWVSMGQESQRKEKLEAFKGFSLDMDLIKGADNEAIILHCLPAHRGEEISDELMESKNSRIFDQAENRLHTQQALLVALLGGL